MDHSFEDNVNGFESRDVILGIDEAGRGPVLGPMVYACLFYPKENEDLLRNINIDDSKKLSAHNRDKINDKIRKLSDKFGWRIHVMSAEYLSCEMHRRKKHNLNEISHLAAISKSKCFSSSVFILLDLIKHVISSGVNVTEVYIDTVGPPDSYKSKLLSIFPNIHITVKPKADSLYPSVSGASILAKVKRDTLLSDWRCSSTGIYNFGANRTGSFEQGSGYPGDPKTKEFLRQVFDPVFGFPSIVRFSWSTASEIIDKRGYSVMWGGEETTSQQKIKLFRDNEYCKFLILQMISLEVKRDNI
ncbi:hypothetical protein OJ253_1285 [Cryptosporidium canis]|uniref:Ribonuclease n=1 Tax=Cryptosporidium canis TaxID=195482 RepID=A0A9D5HXZ0_9CRYT|nr:hypothetical protein OJ253_1285 [Cryptosporidium canis]